MKVISALFVAMLVTGCAGSAEYTKQHDPFKAAESKSQSPLVKGKLCLLYTENSHRAFALAEKAVNSPFLPNMAAAEPRRLQQDITQLLASRFREVVRIGSADETAAQQCDLALGLDLKLSFGAISFTSHTTEIIATFADFAGNRIDTVKAEGSSMVPYPSFTSNFAAGWQQAMARLGGVIDSSVKLQEHIASLPSAPVAAAPVSVDLAFWDSVKTSNNPADLQAYLQKFPNGSFTALARTRLQTLGEAVPARPTPLPQPAPGQVNFGRYHALVIGINNYKAVPTLFTAIHDARTVADILQKDYGFKVTLLIDATRNQMLDAFDDLRRNLTETDNLLIYYAGHGHLDADSDRGFWLPVDAEPNRRANWLSNSDITDMARATRAKHVLVVADSCYAGTLTRSIAVEVAGLDDFSRLAQKRARTALVSGGLEPVADAGGGGHSVFAKAFLDALRANDGVVDTSQIFSSMRRKVIVSAQQTPQYGDIRQTGHEGGDFIFVRRK
jgi:hypothetical protein